MILTALKGKLFVISIFLLLDQTFHELFTVHLFRVIKIWQLVLLARLFLSSFPQAREEATIGLFSSNIEPLNRQAALRNLALDKRTLSFYIFSGKLAFHIKRRSDLLLF